MLAVIKKNAKATIFRLAKANRAAHQFTLPLAVFCFFFFPLCAQWVFADDIHIYKDKNGVLTFTSLPTQAGYPRVIRSENEPKQTRSRRKRAPRVLSYDFFVLRIQMKLVIGMARSSFHFGPKDTQSCWIIRRPLQTPMSLKIYGLTVYPNRQAQ
jgi:hypothetical protein